MKFMLAVIGIAMTTAAQAETISCWYKLPGRDDPILKSFSVDGDRATDSRGFDYSVVWNDRSGVVLSSATSFSSGEGNVLWAISSLIDRKSGDFIQSFSSLGQDTSPPQKGKCTFS